MLRKDSVVDKNKPINVVKPEKIGPSVTFGILTAFHTSVENTFKLLKLYLSSYASVVY